MIPFLKFLLRLRLLQLVRVIRNLGIGYGIAFLVIVFFMSLSFLQKISTQQSIFWSILVLLPCLLVHRSRKDWSILYNSAVGHTSILAVEYFFLALPFAILVGYFQGFSTALVGIIGSVAMAFLPFGKDLTVSTRAMNFAWLPLQDFEWRMGHRRLGIGFLFPFIFLFTVPFFFASILLFAFFWAMQVLSFYSHIEPKEFINEGFSIERKIFRHLLLWTIFWLPIAILHLIFQQEYWYFLPISWLFVAILTFFSISYKYAHWQPNRYFSGLETIGSVFLFLMLGGITFPIPFLAGVYYFWKAKKNIYIQ